jgi:hypothetical protein
VSLRLAGRRTLTAGPLAVDVVHLMRVRLGRMRRSRQALPGGRPPAGPARPTVTLTYRLTRLAARTRAEFQGVADLGCDILDGCGMTGVATYAFDDAGGAEVEITAVAPSSRSLSPEALLRELRAGRLIVYGEIAAADSAQGRVTVEALRPSGAEGCRDTAPAPAVALEAAGGASIQLRTDDQYVAPDPLRARCAGPTRADVFGDRRSATGSIPPAALLDPRVDVELTGGGRFAGRGYSGTHTTTVAAQLVRERVRFGRSPGG